MIANKYKVIEKINEGMFGIVFKAENNRTKEMVAIKFENKTNEIKSLKNEAKIYQYLGNANGFPRLKYFGTMDTCNYLVMDLLGNSLIHTIAYYETLSLKTVLVLGVDIIQRIQYIHNKSLLHRDIKPANFVFGKEKDTNKIFLIDFGFAKRYDYNGKHIEESNIRHVVGSINFVSLNVHNSIEPSRRDDIESCIYVILTMLLGKLEWFCKTNIDEIVLLKKQILICKSVPDFIKNMLQHARTLAFKETPDYDYLMDLMKKEFRLNGFANDGLFEWNCTN